MKRILLTWEIGGGLGHIIPMRALAQQFLSMGHEVYIALMDLTHAASVFSGMNVKLLQAPYKTGFRSNPILPPMSFPQLLHNNGFSSDKELEGLVRSWKTMFELVGPDVICFDFSPSALVAARNFDCVKVNIGVGFSTPPVAQPLGVFTDTAGNTKKMLADELSVLNVINRTLETTGSHAMKSLDQLFYDNVKSCFQSLPEFDHYSARDELFYYGPVLSVSGVKPKWPKKKYDKKVYVYVKEFPGIAQLLKMFSRFPFSFIVYTNNVSNEVLNSCKAPNLCFQTKPLNLAMVSKEASLAIVNAGHSTLSQFVLAGVPVLMVPLQMEQQMLAVRMNQQKVGWIADTENSNFFQSVESVLSSLAGNSELSVDKTICNKYTGSSFYEKQIQLCHDVIALN